MKQKLITAFSLVLFLSSFSLHAYDLTEALRRHVALEEQKNYDLYRNRSSVQINNDGTATIGQLQWMRCSMGQIWNGSTYGSSCEGNFTPYNWQESRALPDLINGRGGFAGHTDWRLPTIGELASLRVCSSERATSIIDLEDGTTTFERCIDSDVPALDSVIFPNTPRPYLEYWSGTESSRYPGNAWRMDFVGGRFNLVHRPSHPNVILVRDIHTR